MAFVSPTLHVTGDVITAADYNVRYYNERYLKGLDGDITLSDHIVGDAKSGFASGVGTHTHLSSGAEGGKIGGACFSDGIVLPAAESVSSEADNSVVDYRGGKTTSYSPTISIFGKDHASAAGVILFWALNSAHTALVEALRISPGDAPDVDVANNILMESGKTVDGVDVSALDAAVDTVAMSDVTSSRAIDSTVYQNTSGKIKVVAVTADCQVDEKVICYVGATSSPTTLAGSIAFTGGAGEDAAGTATFIVPPGYYYKAEATTGTPTKVSWIEWTLH